MNVFYVMGKALSGELSCPCDRSCFYPTGIPTALLNSKRGTCTDWSTFVQAAKFSCTAAQMKDLFGSERINQVRSAKERCRA